MNKEDYNSFIENYNELYDKAYAIGDELCKGYVWGIVFDEYGFKVIYEYNDSCHCRPNQIIETNWFPVEYLFSDNWRKLDKQIKEMDKEREEKKKREEEEKKREEEENIKRITAF